MKIKISSLITVFLFISVFFAKAQERTISLGQIMNLALNNYPALIAKAYDVKASEKNISISKSTLVPNLNAAYQVNDATNNNINGMYFPQFIMPMTGAATSGNDYNGIVGSAGSLMLDWQPITFGQRKSWIDSSRVRLQYTMADRKNLIFEHQLKVIETYLNVMLAGSFVKIWEKDLEHSKANLYLAYSVVNNGLKPATDTSLFKSQLSRSKVNLFAAQKYLSNSRIYLSQLINSDTIYNYSDTLFYNKLPLVLSPPDSVEHPQVMLFNEQVNVDQSKRKVLTKTAMPTLDIWSNFYGRGSGIDFNGKIEATKGLGIQRFNYGVGLQLRVPLLQYTRIRPEIQKLELMIQADKNRLKEVHLRLRKQLEYADISLKNDIAAAMESPVFLEGASRAYIRIQSRFNSGLTIEADLINSQSELVKTEMENKNYYIQAWKSLLYKASQVGDLNIFTSQINRNSK